MRIVFLIVQIDSDNKKHFVKFGNNPQTAKPLEFNSYTDAENRLTKEDIGDGIFQIDKYFIRNIEEIGS